MTGNLQPLDQKFPIVTPDGRPTIYFIQWAQQKQIDISAGITAEQALAIIELYLADHQLQAGTGISISPSGNLSDAPTIAAEVQAILDEISTTQGSILFRGAADWEALAPGTSGQFLKTNGAGADPEWATGGGGGGGSFSGARVYSSVDFSQGSGDNVLQDWDTEDIDIGNWWDPSNPSYFTIPTGVSIINATGSLVDAASVSGQLVIYINHLDSSGTVLGRICQQEAETTGGDSCVASTGPFPVVPGDRISAGSFLTNSRTLDGGKYGCYFAIHAF